MYKTFVRPKLEYATVAWSPAIKRDIDLIESVQKRFTKRIFGLRKLNYQERLRLLELQPLEERRIIFDLINVYKLINGLMDISFEKFFTFNPSKKSTRGHHHLKLTKYRTRKSKTSNFFSYRVVNYWNSLPYDMVTQPTISKFKAQLATTDLSRFFRGGALTSK